MNVNGEDKTFSRAPVFFGWLELSIIILFFLVLET